MRDPDRLEPTPVTRVTRWSARCRSATTPLEVPGVDRVADRLARVPTDRTVTDPLQEPERADEPSRPRRGSGSARRSRGRRGDRRRRRRRRRRGGVVRVPQQRRHRERGEGDRQDRDEDERDEQRPRVRSGSSGRGGIAGGGSRGSRRPWRQEAQPLGRSPPGDRPSALVRPRRSRPGTARWRSRRGVPPRRERRPRAHPVLDEAPDLVDQRLLIVRYRVVAALDHDGDLAAHALGLDARQDLARATPQDSSCSFVSSGRPRRADPRAP